MTQPDRSASISHRPTEKREKLFNLTGITHANHKKINQITFHIQKSSTKGPIFPLRKNLGNKDTN